MRRIYVAAFLLTASLQAADPAWIEYGPNGPIARTIVDGDQCPSIKIDGTATAMIVHSAPVKHYKVTVCEAALPNGVQSASIGKTALPVAKLGKATKVAVVGDTGCERKLEDGKPSMQDCSDPKKWPFATIAASIAEQDPDVILHVGDYYYREAECKDGKCEPTTYNWKRWDADFFTPAKSLLANAPWIFVRGNHEKCKRAAEGWFRFLDPRPYVWEDEKACKSNLDLTPPYVVTLDGLSVAVFDSSATKDSDAGQSATFAAQLQLFSGAPAGSWVALHHPIWAINKKTPVTDTWWNAWTQAGNATAPLSLVVTGHIHTMEMLSFSDQGTPQIVSGNGGVKLNKGPDLGVGAVIGPRTVSGFESDTDFGFLTAKPDGNGWKFDVHSTKGKVKAKCVMRGGVIVCD